MLGDKKTYEELADDPTGKYKRKLVNILSTLKKGGKISEVKYKYLYPTAENIPRLYCTPKIHKNNCPLRPIVDYTGTIGYNTSRWLADILGGLVGKTKHHVQNSKHLAEELQGVVIEEEDILNSHDVVSLFTNTPIDQVLQIVKTRLDKESILRDYNKENGTKLESDDVVQLLDFILTTTYFTFRGKIYRQLFGTAMGSPVSPIAANIFMEALEQKAIATAPMDCRPKLWLRYVDDVLEIVKKDGVQKLTDHINTIDKSGSIKFTYEEETEGKLPFLDTLIVKKEAGTVKLLVYRKPTHTDQYLNYKSHHPLHQKLGVIRTLYDRKDNLVTEEADKDQEEQKVQTALRLCGYPQWTFKKVKDQRNLPKTKRVTKKKDDQHRCKGMVVLPYVQGDTEKIARTLKQYDIAAAMKPHTTLRSLLVHPKDKRDPENTTDAIYEIPCMNCNLCYIGETGRKFNTRLEEHKSEVNKVSGTVTTRAGRKESLTTTHKSAITDHVVDKNHVIGWREAKIIGTEQDRYKRWIKEAMAIRKKGGTTMNRDEGQYFLSHVFDEILMKKKHPIGRSTGNTESGNTVARRQSTSVSSQWWLRQQLIAETYTVSCFYLDQNLRNFCLPSGLTLDTVQNICAYSPYSLDSGNTHGKVNNIQCIMLVLLHSTMTCNTVPYYTVTALVPTKK